MSLDTLLEAARFIELQELRLLAEEEPRLPIIAPRENGLVRPRENGLVTLRPPLRTSPPPLVTITPSHQQQPPPQPISYVTDTLQHEHSRPRSDSNGPSMSTTIPSPSSSGSNSSMQPTSLAPRAGTREVHNKLEKNRRAHLKECFELLKRQLPTSSDDKKTSNLAILGSAIRYIQVLKRKERECEHEMERLAREKIAAQQRLLALKREISSTRQSQTLRIVDPKEDLKRDDRVNGQVLGIPISITTSGAVVSNLMDTVQSVNLTNKLPVQIAPHESRKIIVTNQSGDNGLAQTISTTLVHPAHIHLPISQVVRDGSLVVAGALQLVSGPNGSLRVLQPNGGASSREISRITRENGTVTPPGSSESVMVAPLVVSQALITHPSNNTHHITHKMVESQMVKTNGTPLTVSAGYLGVVKPMVVVTSSEAPSTSS